MAPVVGKLHKAAEGARLSPPVCSSNFHVVLFEKQEGEAFGMAGLAELLTPVRAMPSCVSFVSAE